jgi:NADH-quinone oxidoreductase subunit C
VSKRVEAMGQQVEQALGERVQRVVSLPDELTYETDAGSLLEVCRALRDHAALRFEVLVDVSGIDYLEYGRTEWKTQSATGSGFSRGAERMGLQADAGQGPAPGRRFAVVYHLLSVTLNQRLRLRVFCADDVDPMVPSVCDIWSAANWFEREAFDLYGVLFGGHPDLRRLLTDYGFIGHPFRKDFPLSGNVEVRYDPEKKRVVYEPVSIEPRVLVPKVIRHDNRYEPALKDRPAKGGA